MNSQIGKLSSNCDSLDGSFHGMTEDNQKLMEQYQITFEQKTVYCFYYKGYKYEKLSDAVNYAKIQTARSS